MSKNQLLILINNYFSSSEINAYLSQLDNLEKKNINISVVINDNTGEFIQNITVKTISTYTLLAPHNLGYMGGCANGYDHWVNTLNNPIPKWVMISNTDLTLPKNFFNILDRTQPTIGVLSPVVINSNNNIQNPHIINRLTNKKFKRYIKIFNNPAYSLLYLLASTIKSKLWRSKDQLSSYEGTFEIYAAHGSIFFLTRSFFEEGGTLTGSPFLYGEEIFIAEQNYRFKLSSIIDQNITVMHNEHSSTSSLTLLRKRELLLSSYKEIYQQFLITEKQNETNIAKHGFR